MKQQETLDKVAVTYVQDLSYRDLIKEINARSAEVNATRDVIYTDVMNQEVMRKVERESIEMQIIGGLRSSYDLKYYIEIAKNRGWRREDCDPDVIFLASSEIRRWFQILRIALFDINKEQTLSEKCRKTKKWITDLELDCMGIDNMYTPLLRYIRR